MRTVFIDLPSPLFYAGELETYEQLMQTFSKEYQSVTFPRQDHSATLITVEWRMIKELANYNVQLFNCHVNYAVQNLSYPFPIAGVVLIALRNTSIHQENFEPLVKGRNKEIGIYATNLAERYNYKVFVPCIGFEPLFVDVSDPAWWATSEKSRASANKVAPLVTYKNYLPEELDQIVPDTGSFITDQLGLPREKFTGYIDHPKSPYVKIRPWHIGLGEDASHNFVLDCIQSLLPIKEPFRVWVDATPTESEGTLDGGNRGRNIRDRTLNYDNKLLMSGVYRSAQLSQQWEIIAPHHVYLEYEDVAYDSMYAFEGVPIQEYQAKLDSTWRRHLDVPASADIDTIVEALAKLVNEAKNARIGST